jgi:hypothetical protein
MSPLLGNEQLFCWSEDPQHSLQVAISLSRSEQSTTGPCVQQDEPSVFSKMNPVLTLSLFPEGPF